MIKDLSRKLKDLRVSQNLSQSDVAKRLDISPSIVSGYETGERTPSTEKLLALSYLYKCSVDYLLGKSKERPNAVLDVSGLNDRQVKALQELIETMRNE